MTNVKLILNKNSIMWKTKIEEWLHALIPFINTPLDKYDPFEIAPTEINFKFKLDMSEKNDLVWLLNPRLNYACTTTDLMVKLRTMIDLLELLEKRGVNVEKYVIRRKETSEAPVYVGPLQTVQLQMANVWATPAPIEDLSQFKPQITKLGEEELLEMRDNKVRQLNEEYGLSLTEKDIYIVRDKLILSAEAEKLIKQTKHQKEMTDVLLAAADERELRRWEATLPAYTITGIEAFYGETFVILDNLLVNVEAQKIVAELKTEEERKMWSSTGCDFKPTKRKFSKSIRTKLDETRKSARQNDLQ